MVVGGDSICCLCINMKSAINVVRKAKVAIHNTNKLSETTVIED
jgi:hypothetical protein